MWRALLDFLPTSCNPRHVFSSWEGGASEHKISSFESALHMYFEKRVVPQCWDFWYAVELVGANATQDGCMARFWQERVNARSRKRRVVHGATAHFAGILVIPQQTGKAQ